MSSKRQIRKTAAVVREELRFMERSLQAGDMHWALVHAQQAACFAVQIEELIEVIEAGSHAAD
jgi:HEPN domain-containing protein